MAVDVVDYVESLKRAVQPPGANLYPSVTNAQWVGYLTDAFWEARLDGFLQEYTLFAPDPTDLEDAEFRPAVEGGADITGTQVALVILYAALGVLRNKILNTSTSFRAKAGPVEFEQEASATMLAEMLKQLRATKDRILEALEDDTVTATYLIDAYSTRLYNPVSYWGGIELAG